MAEVIRKLNHFLKHFDTADILTKLPLINGCILKGQNTVNPMIVKLQIVNDNGIDTFQNVSKLYKVQVACPW